MILDLTSDKDKKAFGKLQMEPLVKQKKQYCELLILKSRLLNWIKTQKFRQKK